MPYKAPSLLEQLQEALQNTGEPFSVTKDPTYQDRYYIRHQLTPAEPIAINLNRSNISGPAGESLLLSSQSSRQQIAITPSMLAGYNRETKQTSFQVQPAIQNIAFAALQAFNMKSNNDSQSAQSAFGKVIREGTGGMNTSIQLPGFSSIASGSQLEAQKVVGQVAYLPYAIPGKVDPRNATKPNAPILPWELDSTRNSYITQASFGTGEIGVSGTNWNNFRSYAFAISGNLEPVPAERVIDGGMSGSSLLLSGAPGKVAKRRSIEWGNGTFNMPYNYENGLPGVMQPASIRGMSPKVNWATPNLLTPTGKAGPREIRTMLFDANLGVFAGGGLSYTNKQDVNPDFFGSPSVQSRQIEINNAYEFGQEGNTLNLNKIAGTTIYGGRSGTIIGYQNIPGQEKPEAIRLAGKPSDFVVQGSRMTIPAYMEQSTGKFVSAPGVGIISTEEIAKIHSERLGIPVSINPNATDKAFLEVAGAYRAPGDVKMAGMKMGTIPTGQSQNVSVGGLQVPISYATAEVKTDATVRGFFETQSYEQTRSMLYENADVSGLKGASKFADWFSSRYASGENGEAKSWDPRLLAARYSKMTGQNLSSQQFMNQVFSNVITNSDQSNISLQQEHFERYGAAWLQPGSKIGLGVVSPGNIESIKQSEREAWISKNSSDKGFEEYFGQKYIKGQVPQGAAHAEYSMALSDRALVMKAAVNQSTEWNYNPRINPALRETLARNYSIFSKQIGADAASSHTSASGVYAAELRSAIAWQTSAATGELNEENSPTRVRNIGPDEARRMQVIANDSSLKASERLEQLQQIAGNERDVLRFQSTGAFLPAPGTMQGAVYAQGSKEYAGLASPYLRAISNLSEAEINPVSGGYDPSAGLSKQEEFYNQSSQALTSGGEMSKSALAVPVNSGMSGGYRLGLALEHNQFGAMPNMVDSMVRRMGFGNERLVQQVSRGLQRATDIFGAFVRHPQTSGASSVFGMNAVMGRGLEALYGSERYKNIVADPRNVANYLMPMSFGKASFGDWDVDKFLGVMGIRRQGKGIERLDTSELQDPSVMLSNQRASDVQQTIMPDPNMRQGADAMIQGAIDAQSGVNPLEKAISARKEYSVSNAQNEYLSMRTQKTLGMGIGYNLRQPLIAAMSAFGSSNKMIERVMNAMPAAYQPALDFALPQDKAAGVDIAKVMSGMNFKMNSEGNPMIEGVGYSGDTRYKEKVGAGSGDMYPLLNQFAKIATRSIKTKWSDQTQLFSPEGLAGMFGVSEEDQTSLISKLEKTQVPEERQEVLQQYLGGLSKEEQYGVPLAQASLIRAGSKAVNQKYNRPETLEAYNAFMKNVPEQYASRIRSGVSYFDILGRWKSGAKGTSAASIHNALKNLTGYAGDVVRGMASRAGIPIPEMSSDSGSWTQQLSQAPALQIDGGGSGDQPPVLPPTTFADPGEEPEKKPLSDDDKRNLNLQNETGQVPYPEVSRRKLRSAPGPTGNLAGGIPAMPFNPLMPAPKTRTQMRSMVESTYAKLGYAMPTARRLNARLESSLMDMGFNLTQTPIHEALSQALENDPEGLREKLGPDLKQMISVGKVRDLASKTYGNMLSSDVNPYPSGSPEYERIEKSLGVSDRKTLSGQSAMYNMAQVSKVFSPTDAKVGISLPTQELESFNKLLAEQKEAYKNLKVAKEDDKKQIEEEISVRQKRIDLEKPGAILAAQISSSSQMLSKYEGQIFNAASTGQRVDPTILNKVDTERSRLEKYQKAYSELGQQEEDDGKGLGGFFRKTLGGFGAMYIKSISSFATQGLGQGMQERMQLEQQLAQSGNQLYGTRNIPYSQQQILANQTALNGTNNNPLMMLEGIKATNPLVQSGLNTATAGIGAFALTSWMAGNIGGATGQGLQKLAGPIGLGIAAFSGMADIASRTQDPLGLGYRLGASQVGKDNVFGNLMEAPDIFAQRILRVLPGQQDAYRQSVVSQNVYSKINQGMQSGLSMSSIMSDQSFESENPLEAGKKLYLGAGKEDYLPALAKYLLTKNPNATPDAASRTAQLMMRNQDRNLSSGDIQSRLLADYQSGISSEDLATQMLSVVGGNARSIYKAKDSLLLGSSGGKVPFLSATNIKGLLDQNLTEEQRSVLSGGIQAASTLNPIAMSRMPGVGSMGGQPQSLEKMEAFFNKLSELVNTPAMDVVKARMNTYSVGSSIGRGDKGLLQIDDLTGDLTPREAEGMTSRLNAQTGVYQQRINLAQKVQQQMYSYGQQGAGNAAYEKIIAPGISDSQMWMAQRLYSGDPMAMARMGQLGFDFNSAPGLKTLNGSTISAQYSAFTDISLGGKITGMNWGTSSFQVGTNQLQLTPAQIEQNKSLPFDQQIKPTQSAISAQTIGRNIWGSGSSYSPGLIGAGVGGFNLSAPMTLPDGTVVSSVGGQQGMQLYMAQQNRQFQLQQQGLSQRGLDLQSSNMYNQWGLQDESRTLQNTQQQWQFGFQQRQLDMSNRQWYEDYNLNKEEKGLKRRWAIQDLSIDQQNRTMQRDWTKQDWAYQDQTRDLQWGWQQQDFTEEKRFLTGRQRKIAERQQDRATIMHGLEGNQINTQRGRQQTLWDLEDAQVAKQIDRQKALWALEDERFALQKKQHDEQTRMQQESLDKQKEFYTLNKALEDKRIAVDREYQTEQLKLQQANLDLQVKQSQVQFEFSQTMMQLGIYMDTVNGQLKTMTDDALTGVLGKVTEIVDQLLRLNGVTTPSSTPAPAPKLSGVTATSTLTTEAIQNVVPEYIRPVQTTSAVSEKAINISIGGEFLKQVIIDTVKWEVVNG